MSLIFLEFWQAEGQNVISTDGTIVAVASSPETARRLATYPSLHLAAERLFHACELESDPVIENARELLGNALDQADGTGRHHKQQP